MPRVFIALDLPDAARSALVTVQDALRAEGLFGRTYTAPAHLHLTLKFLGEISTADLAWVQERLRGLSAVPFTARLGEAGTFGRRIVWVRLHGAAPLQRAVDLALRERYAPEARFMGHITIARPKDLPRGASLASAVEGVSVPACSFPVRGITLYVSELSSSGPAYRVVERFSL